MENKKLVYISHPSSGLESNTKKIEHIVRTLYSDDEMYNNYCFVSPVHCYGFMYKEYESNYNKGLSFCTDLLKHCDIMLLCGDWESSRGCKVEKQLCEELNIPIVEVPDDKKLAEIISRQFI
jgi:hypothetical protein